MDKLINFHFSPQRHLNAILVAAIILSINLTLFQKITDIQQIALASLVIAVVIFRVWTIFHLALLAFIMSVSEFFPSLLNSMPALLFLTQFILSTLCILPFAQTRTTLSWATWGKLDRTSLALSLATGLLSTIALVLWATWSDNLGIGVHMMQGLAEVPNWLVLCIVIPSFALINAFIEEIIYRGVFQEALQRVLQRNDLVLILQASAFAAVHFAAGFPNGYMGYSMVFVYGWMLGYLRIRSQGLMAPYLAHVISDLTIGYYLFIYVL